MRGMLEERTAIRVQKVVGLKKEEVQTEGGVVLVRQNPSSLSKVWAGHSAIQEWGLVGRRKATGQQEDPRLF